ncbi:MAG: hypothetical protein A2W52_01020 [Candidatus Taylorbacteria bacterium RIFCSPHIGHO2_02_49_25]|uniref:Capsule polysaccharide biosynthesis protein n=1 Tax=Candidatus Taylorbacteria bacterium RIFCSPHIGHO2_02_49_25 TaxID=1802305 RepID=A0A1G2MAL1_9BACT|nr:MAG: Capsule polysaccharide export protein [Parcubacteria group bacterium GW2011_GWF2_50_9]OHA19205.1 MAG: hypothetical protein A2759_00760 [Candidatus Taylorbacteria bacterium RIFCSPHIGHO2_01_FULL_49_60]OHA20965.1 MAG: hypothetical protein A2W52_01020 [Candidatus Taylorbacteria bacterium RIFCSPHIGHO2_02_49_25]OHA37026.1 MAG: hypothetical protein A3B27_03020 [Candidatus Taylorbacteria bacterium RIFCSPLOWO2_01_FULL_50_130]OHA37264.1 MAG: hypothetical protein A2W65_03265 [Candidatus Taylorbact
MRLFFVSWDGKKFGLSDVVAQLKEKSHEIVYWTYFREGSVDQSKFPHTIFHSVFDALEGKPANGVDTSDFQPPGADLMREFQETELTVLTMMGKKYWRFSLEERKHLYYRFLGYWYGVLQMYKPDAIVYSAIPHTVYDFVMYALAQKMRIKTIIFEPILLTTGWTIVMRDYKVGSSALIDEIERNDNKQFSLADLRPSTRGHYQKYAEIGEDTPPLYTQQALSFYKGIGLFFIKLRSLWTSLTVHGDFSVFMTLLTYIPRRLGPNLKKEYLRVQSTADFAKKFVYATLQYQPESQTCPQAGVFADQLLMIETLSAALPKDWFIYVKEHPALWPVLGVKFYNFRPKGYYEALAGLKNVKVVPVGTNSFQLIRHSQAVATGAGSVGWEAILRSKPVLVFGYPWYQHCEGAFKVKDTVSCKEAMQKIKKGFKISQQKVINLLACLDKVSVEAYFDSYTHEVSKIGVRQNIHNIVRAIETELQK